MARRADSRRATEAERLLSDQRWRLNNLYWIINEEGKRVRFEMNWAQEALFEAMHYQNVILKARQLGCTTFLQIFMLDACLFNSNVRAGTIAHTLTDAQAIFRDKVKYPYDNLPEEIRRKRPLLRDSTNELALSNNSVIRVATSHRSGTLHYLHISEYGKLCARYPEKAREVRTGALNTVQAGQIVWIESTAEGQEGHFFELCQSAQSQARLGTRLTPLDFKFQFFPWWKAPKYRLDPAGVPIPDDMERYFAKLKETDGITFDAAQKAWYVKKAATQLGDMKREYPSTPKEAFEASLEGSYYGALMETAETEGRVGHFPADPNYVTHTTWDIGRSHYTSIWFWQRLPKRCRLVGFFQDNLEGMPYYARIVREMYEERGWKRAVGEDRAVDYVPHDARVTEWGSDKTRLEQMMGKGLNPRVGKELSFQDGINAVLTTFSAFEFDEENCSEGIMVIKAYCREWDEDAGRWRDKPHDNWAADGADALRYVAITYQEIPPPPEPKKPKPIEFRMPTINEMVADHLRSVKGRRTRIEN